MGEDGDLRYASGFGNHLESEAIPGALPKGMNTPQHAPFGLYAEQLSGTAFTLPRGVNARTWMYRLSPSVTAGPSVVREEPTRLCSDFSAMHVAMDQLRWSPLPAPEGLVTFVEGLVTYCGAGSAAMKQGVAIHVYSANTDMVDEAFANMDGDMLVVPQEGGLLVTTELGRLTVPVGHVLVIPRGIAFAVAASGNGLLRGYALEVFDDAHFRLPDLGVIGANGLAEPRDVEHPVAWFEDRACAFRLVAKMQGQLAVRDLSHSVFDVVAWHGNYAPYRLDLARFRTVNSVSVDHPDPSIFTVLTVPGVPGGPPTADFVIFPPRWLCAEQTFRPPYFHRNCMAEFMGLISGGYDAKSGFRPGAASLHNVGTPHGPDKATYDRALVEDTTTPSKFVGGLAFMFECRLPLRLTDFAAKGPTREGDYRSCWDGLPRAAVPRPPP